ncbi:MAG: hypothetical protein ABI277_12990 [Burkholderiaceae bacterium]
MILPRVVAPETLDHLAADDPAAMRSRRDLRRVHRVMRTVSIVGDAIGASQALRRPEPFRVLELGAGDGTLMLRVAGAIGRVDAAVHLTLLDRLALIDPMTIDGYARLGWQADVATADVLEWAAISRLVSAPIVERWDLIVANLFLHHFEGSELRSVLRAIATRGDRLFACEPRRSRLALVAAHLTGLIGANAVTREDAVLSVHAGFRDDELTATWQSFETGWTVREYGAGPFSHCFDASRRAVT